MAPSHESDLRAVLKGLRRAGDEAQLTRTLAAFAREEQFAAKMAAALLSSGGHRRVGHLGTVPQQVLCREEVTLTEKGRNRPDLIFENAREGFYLLVELKLHSGYGERQLERYVEALEGRPHGAVLAVTTTPPRYGELGVHEDPRWLGSVRWARALPRLRTLTHPDAVLDAAWQAFLDVLVKQGDFGTVEYDREALTGWARYDEGKQVLIGLMAEIAAPVLEIVRSEVAGVSGEVPSVQHAGLIDHKGRQVFPWKERIHLQVAVPADPPVERLRVQFLGGPGGPHFTVEARYPDARPLLDLDPDAGGSPELRRATDYLAGLPEPFSVGRDWENYWSRVHPPAQWLDAGPDVHEVLLSFVRDDVRVLAESGIFQALPRGVEPIEQSKEPQTDE